MSTVADLKVGDIVQFASNDLRARITEIGDNSDAYGHSGLYIFAEFIDENGMHVCDTAFVRQAHHVVINGQCFRR